MEDHPSARPKRRLGTYPGFHSIPNIYRLPSQGQSQYNEKGAMLTGGTYLAPNGSVIWKGLGFSANGPYDCAFAWSGNRSEVSG